MWNTEKKRYTSQGCHPPDNLCQSEETPTTNYELEAHYLPSRYDMYKTPTTHSTQLAYTNLRAPSSVYQCYKHQLLRVLSDGFSLLTGKSSTTRVMISGTRKLHIQTKLHGSVSSPEHKILQIWYVSMYQKLVRMFAIH